MKAVDDVIWDFTYDDAFCRKYGVSTTVCVHYDDFDVLPTVHGVTVVELPPPAVSRHDIINRILESRSEFEERNQRRSQMGKMI